MWNPSYRILTIIVAFPILYLILLNFTTPTSFTCEAWREGSMYDRARMTKSMLEATGKLEGWTYDRVEECLGPSDVIEVRSVDKERLPFGSWVYRVGIRQCVILQFSSEGQVTQVTVEELRIKK